MACYRDPQLARREHRAQEGRLRQQAATPARARRRLPAARRANGMRSRNLMFSVPGFALGGATTDHFLAGTKFHRVDVPTDSGQPSISIPLWVKDSAGRYRKRSGAMRFFYGYIVASDGAKRFGWMAEPALMALSGC